MMNDEKIGMYTKQEIFDEIANSMLGRSMYDAIINKIEKQNKALEDIKEYIEKEDISKYVDCRSSDGEDKFKQPILDIINKALGDDK